MFESTAPSSRNSTDAARARIAEQILDNRRFDRSTVMTTDRGAKEYEQFLAGLDATLEYARSLSKKKWLDIGAGITKGIFELSQTTKADGLSVEATVLHRSEQVQQYLGNEKTHITSAEVLRGISDASISLVTAVNSVAYSDAPELAVASIDRVLEQGGIFHGSFQDPETSDPLVAMKPVDGFLEAFQTRGYDTVVAKNPDQITGTYILIAIKPGGTASAKDILNKNIQSSPKTAGSLLPPDLERKVKGGFAIGLDLLKEKTVDGIAAFVADELRHNRGFTEIEAELVMKRLLARFTPHATDHQK
jgi:ubiquinone/menaquinone biosynthesis C-methylase UbiE